MDPHWRWDFTVAAPHALVIIPAAVIPERRIMLQPQRTVEAPREFFQAIGATLDQHGHIQTRKLERVGHALFVAEIRPADEHPVNVIRVLLRQLGTFADVVVRFDAAELGISFAELNGLDAKLRTKLCDVGPRLGDQQVGKETAVAAEDRKGWWLRDQRAQINWFLAGSR